MSENELPDQSESITLWRTAAQLLSTYVTQLVLPGVLYGMSKVSL